MRVGSLFAGVGGFDLAAERAGMQIAWQSENDPHASAVLAEHWPEITNLGDIHGIRTPPDVDVLAGGFPCQDYSVAGPREGLAGDRGALWWEFHRLIAAGRPRWVIGENVPGLLSSRAGADFATIIDSLTELGYRVAWRVLDAQYFGVAQRRRRVFIVGSLGAGSPSEVLALAEGLSGHPQPSRTSGQSDAPTLGARTKGGGGLGTDTELDGGLIPSLSYALTARAAMDRPESGAVTLIPFHATQGPSMVRRLTPTECERLQGFPDGWTQSQSDTQRYRQMGNAVAVPVAEWIMRRIAEEER